tara:strand:- start:48175 stop:48777 length:603 start_codon:yes stop_codon:yes gene_type:complete
MSREDMCILGAGGHAKIVIATAESAGWNIVSVHDDDTEKQNKFILEHPVLGALSNARGVSHIAIGDNRRRRLIAERLSLEWKSLIHKSALVHASVTVGQGSLICAGAIVQPGAIIGEHVIINTGAVVEHDCVVGDFSHIAPRACVAGNVSIGPGCLIGVGAIVMPQITLGSWCVAGAGSVVTKNLDNEVKVAGVPAKVVR